MTALVQLEDVFRVYPSPEGGVAALQGLTLAVEEGELCVVLGPSGSGKSTLLRIVAGFDRASAGSVRIAGVDVGSLSGWGAARFRSRSIGYADQHYWRALAGELTARELVGIQLGLAGIDKEQRDTRADELLERVGLGDRRDAHPRELSGGEQQRIALCAALASRPVLLIADEPTGELDAATARDVLTLIAELVHESGGTALVVSHDPASAERADRVIHVRDGRISDERIAGAAGDGAIVVGRGGWLRLPEDLLRTAGIDRHATAELRGGAVVLEPTGPSVSETQASPVPHKQAVPEPPKGASVSETQSPSSFITVRALDEALRHCDTVRAARRCVRAGEADRRDRAVGLGEDDVAAPPRRPRAAGRGRRPASTGSRSQDSTGPDGRSCGGRGSRSSARPPA